MSHHNFTMTQSTTNETLMVASDPGSVEVMEIPHTLVASVEIISNYIVVVAFLNHKKLKAKIPNRFIVNQVSPRRSILLKQLSVTFGKKYCNNNKNFEQNKITKEMCISEFDRFDFFSSATFIKRTVENPYMVRNSGILG